MLSTFHTLRTMCQVCRVLVLVLRHVDGAGRHLHAAGGTDRKLGALHGEEADPEETETTLCSDTRGIIITLHCAIVYDGIR